MPRVLEVKPREPRRVWVRYDDGVQGEVDLSDLAGRGVFKAWDEDAFFNSVKVGVHGEIAWGDRIDLCPDALYLRLTGKTPDQMFPALKKARMNA